MKNGEEQPTPHATHGGKTCSQKLQLVGRSYGPMEQSQTRVERRVVGFLLFMFITVSKRGQWEGPNQRPADLGHGSSLTSTRTREPHAV